MIMWKYLLDVNLARENIAILKLQSLRTPMFLIGEWQSVKLS